ncbi:hypothetical protein [Kitasatospora sp. NPDC059571]|uniref:hypothetical protein n=1 Tax=Kitasatospora sp. NPDC059571 TaxID=3346871 RepID=UPI00369A6230
MQKVASSDGRAGGHDKTALDEIELAGELMIAASASADERLANEQIDRVLLDGVAGPGTPAEAAPDRWPRPHPTAGPAGPPG